MAWKRKCKKEDVPNVLSNDLISVGSYIQVEQLFNAVDGAVIRINSKNSEFGGAFKGPFLVLFQNKRAPHLRTQWTCIHWILSQSHRPLCWRGQDLCHFQTYPKLNTHKWGIYDQTHSFITLHSSKQSRTHLGIARKREREGEQLSDINYMCYIKEFLGFCIADRGVRWVEEICFRYLWGRKE